LGEEYVRLSDLRKVSGIGEKTIQRIKEALLDGNKYTSEYNPNCHLDINNLYHGDCLELMNGIPDKSVDMILCDLPYGTTACKWDKVIPFEPLWKQYERIIKENGAIVLTASQPFTSALVMSNPKLFKYSLVWEKTLSNDRFLAKLKPMKFHEDICVFSKGTIANGSKRNMKYFPQNLIKVDKIHKRPRIYETEHNFHRKSHKTEYIIEYTNYPKSVLKFSNGNNGNVHPTQKPVDLFEYLIKTYTNEDDLVLDNCIGSGTTAIAAINTNRQYIGIELNDGYYKLAKDRINSHIINNNLQDRYSLLA